MKQRLKMMLEKLLGDIPPPWKEIGAQLEQDAIEAEEDEVPDDSTIQEINPGEEYNI